ncbi:rod shape-determining protein MreD [Roseospirillum parvum]|uniref:Rod shape-determining protein MreD n=1 Tax=Roseospirillum parvum TaxID=83401 RepID=A0A1G7V311_9PROT|nr:rod shape-determining protein MreD [Roseospirillum parvum]SDG54202.1 rod shape-determining protein MreD [Roseospirillum parvum]
MSLARLSLGQRTSQFLRRQVPVALAVLLLVLAQVPTQVPGLVEVAPMLGLICVYYWAIYRPDLFGAASAFALGLLDDILSGAPLGSGALALLLAHGVISRQRTLFHAKPFAVTWPVFAVVAAGAYLVRWLGAGLVRGAVLPAEPVVVGWLMTVAAYPLLGWLLASLNGTVVKDDID